MLIAFKEYPKLVKTVIGTLINLTVNETIRAKIAEVAPFSQAVFEVFGIYQDNKLIIDYLLKFVANVTKKNELIFAFSTEEFFVYLLIFLKAFAEEDEIVFNSLKLMRIVTMNSKILKRPRIRRVSQDSRTILQLN